MLPAAIQRVLGESPGLTAREIARILRGEPAFRDLRKRQVNQVVYSTPGFRCEWSDKPRWSFTGLTSETSHEPVAEALVLEQTDPRREPARLVLAPPPDLAFDDSASTVVDEFLPFDLASVGEPAEAVPASAPLELTAAGDWVLTGLRDWQREALTAWFDAGARGVVEAVTGTGKTHLGIEAACRMAAAGGSTTVLVPSVELQDQWRRKFLELAPGLRLALVGGGSNRRPVRADVTIALVQSAVRRDLVSHAVPSLIVADEVHRYGAAQWARALQPGYDFRLGLTATLERGGDDGVREVLEPYFGGKVFSYDYRRAVPEAVVALFTLTMLGVGLSRVERIEYDELSGRIRRARKVLGQAGLLDGPLHEQMRRIAAAARDPRDAVGRAARDHENATRRRRKLLAECRAKVDAVRELSEVVDESAGAVIFTQSVDTAVDAARELERRGIRAAATLSGTAAADRRRYLERLGSGDLHALCAPRILDEGVDVPDIDLGIVVGASKSRRQMIQRLGRVIRLKEDGSHARLIVLFARGTVEDPSDGAHADFMEMVADVASRDSVMHHWTIDAVRRSMELPGRHARRPERRKGRPGSIYAAAGPPRWRPDAEVSVRRETADPAVSPAAAELAAWVKRVALDLCTDEWLSDRPRMPARVFDIDLRAALRQRLGDIYFELDDPVSEWHVGEELVDRSITGPRRRLSLVVQRPDRPDVVVHLGGQDHRVLTRVLSAKAASGSPVVWVRWAGGPVAEPHGVAVVDLRRMGLPDLDRPSMETCPYGIAEVG